MPGLVCSNVCSRNMDLREVDRKKIEVFEMWIWRRMDKISWSDKITNDDVLKRVNEERSLLKEIWQRKHRWIVLWTAP